MRVIEPLPPRPAQRRWRPTGVIAILIIIIAASGWWRSKPSTPTTPQIQSANQTAADQTGAVSTNHPAVFSHPQFKALYTQTAYPNVQELSVPPPITGNPTADERIRELALKRGYKLSVVPVAPIIKVETYEAGADNLLQPRAQAAWQELKSRADNAKIPLTLVSAYRSLKLQRALFLERLALTGVTAAKIAAGQGDTAVITILKSAAPPGYSRHHSGYTIDLACGRIGLYGFIKTACYKWLSADNYQNAKLSGWIPSYPEGAEAQGPEAEPWEYVWVSNDALLKR